MSHRLLAWLNGANRAMGGKSAKRRSLICQRLESRALLAVASEVVHQFREDDYSLSGTFQYSLIGSDYTDKINDGIYSSNAGHVDWTSPTEGTATFQGVATGTGLTRALFAGSFYDCSRYTIRDEGSLELAMHAGSKTMSVNRATTTSTKYTSYQDLTPGGSYCPPETPPSIFFGGLRRYYSGVFDPTNHTASMSYADASVTYPVRVTSSTSTVDWADSSAADVAISVEPAAARPTIPEGWYSIPQSGTQDLTSFDARYGGVSVHVRVLGGEPFRAPAGGAAVPVGTLRLYWTATVGGASLGAVPLVPGAETAGLYWNSREFTARIDQLPAPPAGAEFLAVAIDLPGVAESTLANNIAHVKLGHFEARNSSSGPLEVTSTFDESQANLLHPADLASQDVRVLAANPLSRLGATVGAYDDLGGFYYDPTAVASLISLAQGETTTDTIQFLAIQRQNLVDEATHTVQLVGVNDFPVGVEDIVPDVVANTVRQFSNLLDNDTDPDNGDRLTLDVLYSYSGFGAAVSKADSRSLKYDPTAVEYFLALDEGQIFEDGFYYEAVDKAGARTPVFVPVNVIGVNDAPVLLGIRDLLTTQAAGLPALPFTVKDWEGVDPTQLAVSASIAHTTFSGPVEIELQGTDSYRELHATVPSDELGRILIGLRARDPGGRESSYYLNYVVGSDTDQDLDGIGNSEEDAASPTGDANQDEIRDAEQVNVVAWNAVQSGPATTIDGPSGTAFSSVAAMSAPAPAGTAAGAEFPVGVVRYQLHTTTPGQTIELHFRPPADSGTNSFFLNANSPPGVEGEAGGWNWMLWGRGNGAKIQSEIVAFSVTDGGRGDQDGVANGVIVGRAGLAKVPDPWHNREMALDIDNNGLVAPLDAIQLINHLNSYGSHALPLVPGPQDVIAIYLDTNSDNFVAPFDAIQVINFLNHRPAGGEWVQMPPADLTSILADEFVDTTVNAPGGKIDVFDAAGMEHAVPTALEPIVVHRFVVQATTEADSIWNEDGIRYGKTAALEDALESLFAVVRLKR